MTCGLALIKRVSRERPWPKSARILLPPVRLQDFFRNSPRTDDRAVDRRVLAIRLGEIGRAQSELQSPDHRVCRLLLRKKERSNRSESFVHTRCCAGFTVSKCG